MFYLFIFLGFVAVARPYRFFNSRLSHVKNTFGRYTIEPIGLSSTDIDFSFKTGEEFEGKIVSALPFGIFVDISKGTNVLLPRSVLSKSSYEKLKSMADSKSDDTVKIELVSVNSENKTLSGKYIPANFKERADISTLQGKDLNSKVFKAAVVSTHDFGIFAEIEEFGVEGLIPASKLGPVSGSVKNSYAVGAEINVVIVEMNVANKKLVLGIAKNKGAVTGVEGLAVNKWTAAIITSVTNFGLFVRPAGTEATGLVHVSQVPRDLLKAMKQVSPPATGSNVTDIEALFDVNDVIKCRLRSVDDTKGKLELTMLPYRENADKDDGYVVDGRDPEGETFKSYESDDTVGQTNYDAQDTLVWWKGQPYQKIKLDVEPVDEEIALISESADLMSGSFRRLFEVDLRADQADFSSKIIEKEEAALREEIGELNGLDDDLMEDMFGMGAVSGEQKFGSYVSMSQVPDDWQTDMEYVRDIKNAEESIKALLKSGKAGEQSSFEALLKEVENELQAAATRNPRAAEILADSISEDVSADEKTTKESTAPVEE